MNRYRSRLFLLSVVACVTACATARVPEASPQQASATAPIATFQGRPIAAELPPEVKRLIDGVRRLHEQPGLILDREAIYKTLDVAPTSLFAPSLPDGRTMTEELGFERQEEYVNWKARLKYSELPKRKSWNVRVELSYGKGSNCYPSRLVESYWGKPFIYRPLGVHAFRGELQRKQRDLPPTGPHDGAPYNAEFGALHANSANVIFFIGLGGCLVSVRASNIFKLKEYSDDHIYHE